MNFKEHIELRNSLYRTSLRTFHYDMEWLSDYLSSISKWRVKVLLKHKFRNKRRNSSIPNVSNDVSGDNKSAGVSHLSDSIKGENNDLRSDKYSIDMKSPSKSDTLNKKLSESKSGCSNESDSENVMTEIGTNVRREIEMSTINENENTSELDAVNEETRKGNSTCCNNNIDDMITYKILTCSDDAKAPKSRKYNNKYNTFGYTLWDYLPLMALLNGCIGVFILFRLSSLMYRYSILSCTISHLVTFMLIGIPISQLEFAIRKRGKVYGLLESIQSLNPTFIGLVLLSLVTVIFIFLYAFHIIGTLSIIIYNIPKTNWRVTLGDAYICNKINESIKIDNLLSLSDENTIDTDVYNLYSLCSYTSMCNVVSPFYQNSTKIEYYYGKNKYAILDDLSVNEEYFSSVFTSFIDSVNLASGDLSNNNKTLKPTWCVPSPSKKLRNLLIMEQSNYMEMLYFSLDSSVKNPEKIVNTSLFPFKKPINKLNKNLIAKIIGMSVSFMLVLLSINGGGKFFRVTSFLSLLSLITLLLTATIQTVANDAQLNIFISMLVTQDGVQHLLSPSIWYSSINNTLLFFGISFFITMFPLDDLSKRPKNYYRNECEYEFENEDEYDNNSADNDYTINNNSGSFGKDENEKPYTNADNVNLNESENINYYSLRSSIKSASFFLLYIVLSSMVVIVSNSALISLSESPYTHLLFPFNTRIHFPSEDAISEINYDENYFNMVGYSKINEESEFITGPNTSEYFKRLLEGGLHIENKIFSKHFLETFNFKSDSLDEIQLLKNQLSLWYKANLLSIKTRSLILGEYMIIYLIITAIEVSNRIPRGVIIFFIMLIFSYAILSACMCACIISKHVDVILNEWIYPLYLRNQIYSGKDANCNSSNDCDIENKQNNSGKRDNDSSYMYFPRKTIKSLKITLIKLYYCTKNGITGYFGICPGNKMKSKMKIITFCVQVLVLLSLIMIAFLINIVSSFIIRLPLDKENTNSEHIQNVLGSNKFAYLDYSSNVELYKLNNNEIYFSKNSSLFGTLFDIRIISSIVNLMLSVTAGIEVFMLTWNTNKEIPRRIVGSRSLKIHYVGHILSTLPVSIGFVLGTKLAFGLCLFTSVVIFVTFFMISRSYARKSFKYGDQIVVKRQIYSPTWWLCISNIDLLRRKFNSKELIDAGLLSYYSDNYRDTNSENSSKLKKINSENKKIIKNISNFNLYCSVRSHQPQFVVLWIILAKYFSTILIKSTVPLTIINIIHLLLKRSDCLEGLFSGSLSRNNYTPNSNGIQIIDYTANYSIFQPLQLFFIVLFSLSGLTLFAIITNYVQRKAALNENNASNHFDGQNAINSISDPLEANIDNILNDVYESLNVPVCTELFSNSKTSKLGKMPQKLILDLAFIENVIE